MSEIILKIKLLKGTYAVCRLEKNGVIPEWAKESEFYSITKTLDELSVVCSQSDIPGGIKCEKDWKILKVEGPLDFSLIGIIASISSILAKKGISIFTISTFDTDYILVKDKNIDAAIAVLDEEKYEVIY